MSVLNDKMINENHSNTIIKSYWFNNSKFIENIPQPAHILVDIIGVFSDDLPNIFIQVEPNIIINNENYLIQNHEKYHTIITFNKNVLEKCPNARHYIYGTSWIDKSHYNNINTDLKKFKISNLSGTKLINKAPGHVLRQIIHYKQQSLQEFPITFFRSFNQKPHISDYGNNPFLPKDDKISLFEEFQFSIVIENSKQDNYFTEKIMDCILTKTIPIYWGCPNIQEYFDTTGWIILETGHFEEIVSKLRLLNENYYLNYKDTIEKNYQKAQEYIDLYKNINNAKKREF
jgi:hypothetical protein